MNLQNQMYQLKMGESPTKQVMPKTSFEKNQSSPQDTEKQKFQSLFGESHEESVNRIKQLEAELKKVRVSVKKEEEARRLAQEFARKKDEETKAIKIELQAIQAK